MSCCNVSIGKYWHKIKWVTIPQAVWAVATEYSINQQPYSTKLQYRKRYELLQRVDFMTMDSDGILLQYRKRYELLQRIPILKIKGERVTIPQAVWAVATLY